jgi:hypothetical protein
MGPRFIETSTDEEDEPYEARWWSALVDLNPLSYAEIGDAGRPTAEAINSAINSAPWVASSPQPNNHCRWLVKGGIYSPGGGQSTQAHWVDHWDTWTFRDWRGSRSDKRMRLVRLSADTTPHTERYLKIVREGAMDEWGSIPWVDEMDVVDAEAVEMRILPGQTTSSWLTVEAEASNGKYRQIALQPIDITVVFGIGPESLEGPTSRKLLENYLETVKIKRDGDVWAIRGKDANDQERIYGIEIVANEAGLLEALQAEGRTVIYDGHANFGLGPNFTMETHKTIASFTNFGVNYTGIPKSYRGDGSEPDSMPYYGVSDVEVPNDASTGLDHLYREGWAYLVLDPSEVQGNCLNYNVPVIGGLRFKNYEGIGAGQNFTKKGAGFNNEWHFTWDDTMLMVSAPGTQVPQNLRYKTFFYNACSSGPHFSENFHHGELVWTNQSCHVYLATRSFVAGIVQGKNTPAIIDDMHSQDASGKGIGVVVYNLNNF